MIPRYTRQWMGRLWSDENRFRRWLEVEILALEAWEQLGKVPQGTAERIRSRAKVDPERIHQIENEVRHDVIAFVTQVAETVGEDGKYIHFGLTSYDVVDTALSSLLREALEYILQDIDALLETLGELAVRFRDCPMVGRTHGVHAEPTTFGLVVAVWYEEMRRNRRRVMAAQEDVSVGKISGAVGTYAHVDPFVEEYVCSRLGLKPAPVSNQILQRDRHAWCVATLAVVLSTLEKMAVSLRGLARTEVREIEEPFAPGQRGSSAMPHKRNPVGLEQICGLARLVRGYAVSSLENNALWHERDISNSSVERVVLPDVTTVTDYALYRMNQILKGLRVYPERMAKNVELTGGLIFSEEVLLALIEAGMNRDEAYKLVQDLAMKSWDAPPSFRERVLTCPEITRRLPRDRIEKCFDLGKAVSRADYILKRLGLIPASG